jgi:hypothetical protein
MCDIIVVDPNVRTINIDNVSTKFVNKVGMTKVTYCVHLLTFPFSTKVPMKMGKKYHKICKEFFL